MLGGRPASPAATGLLLSRPSFLPRSLAAGGGPNRDGSFNRDGSLKMRTSTRRQLRTRTAASPPGVFPPPPGPLMRRTLGFILAEVSQVFTGQGTCTGSIGSIGSTGHRASAGAATTSRPAAAAARQGRATSTRGRGRAARSAVPPTLIAAETRRQLAQRLDIRSPTRRRAGGGCRQPGRPRRPLGGGKLGVRPCPAPHVGLVSLKGLVEMELPAPGRSSLTGSM